MKRNDTAELATFDRAEAAFLRLQRAAHTLADRLAMDCVPAYVAGYDAGLGVFVVRVGLLHVRVSAQAVLVLRRRARHDEVVGRIARGRSLRAVVAVVESAVERVAEAA